MRRLSSRFAAPTYTHYGYDAVWAWARALDAAIRRGDERALLGGRRGGFTDPDKSDLWWHLRNLTFGVAAPSHSQAMGSRGDTGSRCQQLSPDGNGGWTVVAIFMACASILRVPHVAVLLCWPSHTAAEAMPSALGLLMRVTGADGRALDASGGGHLRGRSRCST